MLYGHGFKNLLTTALISYIYTASRPFKITLKFYKSCEKQNPSAKKELTVENGQQFANFAAKNECNPFFQLPS